MIMMMIWGRRSSLGMGMVICYGQRGRRFGGDDIRRSWCGILHIGVDGGERSGTEGNGAE